MKCELTNLQCIHENIMIVEQHGISVLPFTLSHPLYLDLNLSLSEDKHQIGIQWKYKRALRRFIE